MAAFPHAAYRLISKRGANDCAIASLAMILRREYEEVLLASAKVSPTVWKDGLTVTEMQKVAKRLKINTRILKARPSYEFDITAETGVLWVGYNDSAREHVVALFEGGWIVEPEYDPPVMAEHDDYLAVHNAYAGGLLQVIE
jgi:ABC-type bacteriocin/lantibiotic exporter with double-glycine peptidase domain